MPRAPLRAAVTTVFVLLATLVASLVAAPAARATDVRALYDAMRLGDILAVMREEGLAYGDELRTEMFADGGAAGWPRVVSRIYDTDRMERDFVGPFTEALDGADLGPLQDFFASDRGRMIVEFEVTARRALLDEGVEEVARRLWDDLKGEIDPRADLIERFVEVNDLIETNVVGAMNSSLAFYEGLATSDGFGEAWTPDRILSTVWEQEAEIRADTRDWIYPYLTLAFEPLEAEDIEAYIVLSESPEGRALNAALFAAFDVLFVDISREMGTAAARYLEGEDI